MIKHTTPSADHNSLKYSWIIDVAEHYFGKNLTRSQRHIAFAFGYGFLTGVLVATIELVAALYLNARSDLISFLITYGLVFLPAAFFGSLGGLILTLSFDLKKKNAFSLPLVALIEMISIGLICLIYAVYFSPTQYVENKTSLLQQYQAEEDTIHNDDVRTSNILPPKRETAAEDAAEQGINEQHSISIENIKKLSIKEFDEFLEKTGFTDFSVQSRANKATDLFADITLFPDTKNVDWDKFLLELDEAVNDNPHFAGVMISSGLRKDPPFRVVVDIMNRGDQLNGNHLASLATYLTVDEFQQLENYGVDISLPSQTETNVLVMSLLHSDGPELFEFLLSKDNLVFSDSVDVVKEVLALSSTLNHSLKYTQNLIDRGAPVTDETKAWIENELRKTNPAYYAIVKSRLSY